MEKKIRWNIEKARQLLADPSRGGISFEDCVIAIEGGKILDIIQNPSINHPTQKMYVLEIEGYAYSVPFVENDEEIFLKTLFPSRKLTAIYLGKKEP